MLHALGSFWWCFRSLSGAEHSTMVEEALLTMSGSLDRDLYIVFCSKLKGSDNVVRRSNIHCVGWQIQDSFPIETTESKPTLGLSNHTNSLRFEGINIFLTNVRVGILLIIVVINDCHVAD